MKDKVVLVTGEHAGLTPRDSDIADCLESPSSRMALSYFESRKRHDS